MRSAAISSMDENLTRASAVSREITRQLKPLESTVDKASRAKDLSAQPKDLTVQVDAPSTTAVYAWQVGGSR